MLRQLFDHLSSDLAVDLGTANTRVAAPRSGVVVDEPSVVAIGALDHRLLAKGQAVGHAARQLMGRAADSVVVARPMRDGVVADDQLCHALVRQFLRKADTRAFHRRPRVVAAVRGSATPVERRALLRTIHRAGARRVWLAPSIKAAALGADLPIAEPVASLVCDIGAGATEVAVMCLSEIVSHAAIRAGGDALDQAIVDHLRAKHALRVTAARAETLRIELHDLLAESPVTTASVAGTDLATGQPRRLLVTAREARQAIEPILARVAECARDAILGCQPEVAADVAERGLVLTGGVALTPRLEHYLAGAIGLPTRVARDPRLAVLRGALVCLESRDRWRRSLESFDDDI